VSPDDKGISGKRLVPQLAVGCILFTVFGLLATYWVASAMTDYLKKHPFGKPQPKTEAGVRQ
jgi:hypothetical protein